MTPPPATAPATDEQLPQVFEPDENPAPPFQILRPDGTINEGLDPGLPAETLLDMHRHMLRARVLDERVTALQRQGRIGFHIGPPGEEACIVGPVMGLEKTDWIMPSYREFPALFIRGVTLRTYLNNLYGNAQDPVRGRQMPDHWTARQHRIGSVSSPVGTQIPQAVGLAWAAKLQGNKEVALVYFGDGTSSQGDFHVGANFAGVFKTPTILLCRNNQWAISVPMRKQTASATFAQKAIAYGMRGVRVDGNDVLAMYVATQEAAAHARKGLGPTLLEAVTYRLGAHSTSDDPKAYRDEAEVAPWRDRDPIDRFRKYLATKGLLDLEEDAELEARIDRDLKALIKEVEKVPPPPIESMFEDVYKDMPWHLREQLEELKEHIATRQSAPTYG